MSTLRGRPLRAAVGVFVAAASIVWFHASPSLGGFTASTTNSTNTMGSGSLAYTHTYQATSCTSVAGQSTPPPCTGSIAPTAPTPPTGSTPPGTDSITNNGTIPASDLTQQVRAASCGVVQLGNGRNSGNPMLPRYGTTFSPTSVPMTGSGAIAFDGQNPGGYAADVVSQAQPNPTISLGATYGLGIWFKTTSAAGGPLFGIANDPTNATGGGDRILYMNADGTLSFIQNTGGATTTTTSSYGDGNWHFAYVTMSAVNVLFLGVTSTTTIYVDGATAGSGGGLLVGYTSDTGYWHAGWSPSSVTGLSTSYFAGSLSNFVVFNTSNAPAAPTATQRGSQSAFDGWASSATEQWPMNDSGTTTYSGTLPDGTSASSPCDKVDVTWSFTNPPSSFAGSLTTLASGWQDVASLAPGATETGTVSTSRGAGYTATTYLPGLRLYAPLSFRVLTNPVSPWSVTFTWPDASAAFIA